MLVIDKYFSCKKFLLKFWSSSPGKFFNVLLSENFIWLFLLALINKLSSYLTIRVTLLACIFKFLYLSVMLNFQKKFSLILIWIFLIVRWDFTNGHNAGNLPNELPKTVIFPDFFFLLFFLLLFFFIFPVYVFGFSITFHAVFFRAKCTTICWARQVKKNHLRKSQCISCRNLLTELFNSF